MDLTKENSFQIENRVYCFGNPVITVDTLQNLVKALQQNGDVNRPIVIINPQANTVPDFDVMLENFISNEITVKPTSAITKYVLQGATDDQICAMVEEQYKPGSSQSMDYSIAMYRLIRDQSNARAKFDDFKAECDSLWKQHCLNPESTDGSARYSEIVYTLIPAVQTELQEITHKLDTMSEWFTEPEIPYTPKIKTVDVAESVITSTTSTPEISESVVDNKVPQISEPTHEIQSTDDLPPWDIDTTEPVSTENSVPNTISESVSVTNKDNIIAVDTELTGVTLTLKWLDPKLCVMPLEIAKARANDCGYTAIRNQQQSAPSGYVPVPIEYLLMLGIPIYPDGVPIVYTRSGEFMRIGNSDIPMINTKYWFPKPLFDLR